MVDFNERMAIKRGIICKKRNTVGFNCCYHRKLER